MTGAATTSVVGFDSTTSGFNPGNAFGVWGDSGNANGLGVVGSASAASGVGVFGQSTAGTAVKGSSNNGTGVDAASAGGSAVHAHFGPAGAAAVTEAFLATSSLAADLRGDVSTTGNIATTGDVAVGLPAGQQAQRPLHVEGSLPSNPAPGAGAEVHSGGSGGGFSFADRTGGTPAGSFVGNPTKGERWVWYAQNGTARLWSGADVMSAGATGVGIAGALAVGQRMQVQQGPNDPSAGIWFFQSGPKNNQGFVGMSDDTHIGFWGNTGRNWGLTMDTTSGAVSIPNGVGIGGALSVGQRMQVQQGPNDPSAGIWFFQSGPKNNQGFVGMSDDTHIGFWGNTGANWGLTMDTTSGVVSIPHGTTNLTVTDRLTVANNEPAPTGTNVGAANAVCASSQNGTAVWASGKMAVSAFGPSQFNGTVTVTQALNAPGKNCHIDHPADPENKTLTHACVESDEQFNVYSGNVELGDNGEARVTLPKWVAAFNRDFRYQLTCIGQSAPVYVAQEVRDDTFSIAGGTAGMKVSWQLTGVRNDAWAQANPLVVEQDKPEDEKGFFLNPEVFGHDHTRHVQYKRHEHLIEAYPRQAEQVIAAYNAGRTT